MKDLHDIHTHPNRSDKNINKHGPYLRGPSTFKVSSFRKAQ